MNPLVLAAVLPYLSNLTYLNVEGTNFDDFCLEQLSTWVSGLVTLNIARTRVTDQGLDNVDTRLQDLTFFILLGNDSLYFRREFNNSLKQKYIWKNNSAKSLLCFI